MPGGILSFSRDMNSFASREKTPVRINGGERQRLGSWFGAQKRDCSLESR